ncbi:MAG: DNA topoisomerase I [Candidatus Thermoplasmatota archaeon]|nr:DNA topoisomerase I [Candidatus Thermoplasmatota archaeon]
MSSLIIAEKANVALRIATSLSDGKVSRVKVGASTILRFSRGDREYSVLSLRGHIIELDYPKEFSSWRIDNLKELIRVNPVENLKFKGLDYVLKKLNSENNEVIVATDYDREGELIGVETLRLMERSDGIRRARFSALTKYDLVQSFENLAEVDYNLAGSAEARGVIDLMWGAALTRFFSVTTKRLGGEFISVGRVQSPTLTILVEREMEIRDFIPEKYYELSIVVNGVKFNYEGNPIKSKEEADKLLDTLKKSSGVTIKEKSDRERKIYRPVPFSTTEFLRDANRIGVSVERAMAIAETLYQHGKISYPRTDNTVYPRTLSIKSILSNLSDSYLKKEVDHLVEDSKLVPSRGRVETTDHPPIYPTAPMKKSELKGDYFKIYDLIARRFMATVAENADIKETDYVAEAGGLKFVYTASRAVKRGWMDYYPIVYYQEKRDPELNVGDEKAFELPKVDERNTNPPPRFTQGSLLEKMEKELLGTKSTRHEIIQKLYDRGFIEGNPIRVKPLGMAMGESLIMNSEAVARPEMTAKLEKEMDQIAAGSKKKEEVIEDSRSILDSLLDDLISKSDKISEKFYETLKMEKVVGKCPKCGSDLIIDYANNARFIKCTGPSNDFFQFLPRTGKIEVTDEKCPVCGLFLIKVIRKGEKPEIRCVDNKCAYNTDRETFGKCPSDGGNLVMRRSRMSTRFIGCSNYPSCKVTLSVPQKVDIIPTSKVCPVDGFPIAIFKYGKNDIEQCLNPRCPSRSGKKEDTS